MKHTKAVVDSLRFDLRVAESPLIARDLWEGAELVLVGSDLAGKCVENLVPRRSHLLVVHVSSEVGLGVAAESILERDRWAARGGAGLESVLLGIAYEMRREHRSRVEVAARTAGVKAVIPLALCFLPGFFALGVIRIVASLAASTGFLPG